MCVRAISLTAKHTKENEAEATIGPNWTKKRTATMSSSNISPRVPYVAKIHSSRNRFRDVFLHFHWLIAVLLGFCQLVQNQIYLGRGSLN